MTLPDVQSLSDRYTGGAVRLRDPVWMTNFRIHHRAAGRYRRGPVFLAGDAAHIHSPAGAQGMNTGIQDAVNLGWKLAYTLRGEAAADLLDTYEPERAPVGRMVLRFTDRVFTLGTSDHPLARLARSRLVPVVLPLLSRSRTARAYAFRTVSELNIRYRRSALSVEGSDPPRTGPRAGDRLPDARIVLDGQATTLHRALAGPRWRLLLCGPPAAWPAEGLARLRERYAGLVTMHHLAHGPARDRLTGGHTAAHLLVRPDGHLGYRAGGTDVAGLDRYLRRWLAPPGQAAP